MGTMRLFTPGHLLGKFHNREVSFSPNTFFLLIASRRAQMHEEVEHLRCSNVEVTQ